MTSLSVYAESRLEPPPVATVDGCAITLPTLDVAVASIIDAARQRRSFSVCTLNLDHIVKLRREPRFRAAYERSRMVTADGMPVVWLARLSGARIERATGADIVLPLAAAAAGVSLPIFLFGTTPHVLARAGQKLAESTPSQLDIAGTMAPGSDFDPEGPEADAALDAIAASGARLCLVALGAPKQEIFSARAVERGLGIGFVNVGAALDFLSGHQVRAPHFMRRTGLEWLWRLGSDPRRLALRYLRCAVVLVDLIVRSPRQQAPGSR